MNKLIGFLFFATISFSALANGGLDALPAIFIMTPIVTISLIVFLFSSLIRFTGQPGRRSRTVHVSGFLFIISGGLFLLMVGVQDADWYALLTILGVIFFVLLIIYLNNKLVKGE